MLLRTKHNATGFTLLEIVIAMAILSFSLVALLSATNRALTMNASAIKLTDAVFLAREQVELFYMEPLPEPGVSEKKETKDFPQFEWKTEVKPTPFEGLFETSVLVFNRGESAIEDKTPVLMVKTYVMK